MVTSSPGFLTTLPVAALVGIVGVAAVFAYCLRRLATRSDTSVAFSTGGLALLFGTAHVLVLGAAGVLLGVTGGLPAGPLYGPPLLTVVGIYGGPLAVGATVVGWLVVSRGHDTVPRRFWALASVAFAVAHLLSIPTIVALFTLLG